VPVLQAEAQVEYIRSGEQNDGCGNSTTQSHTPDEDILMSETC